MTEIPYFLIPYFRTNHAGETGAVYIYKGILAVSKNKDIIAFSQRHLKTESNHLKIISEILPKNQQSKLIFLWKILGYVTGFLPALLNDKFVYATIYSVESFVEQHYQDQINLISEDKKYEEIKHLIKNKNIKIVSLNRSKYESIIKKQKSNQTFSNLASLLQSFEYGRDYGDDLIFFAEDDYIHNETMLKEVILTFERISSQLNHDIFMCPSDYPYNYMSHENTNIFIGSHRHWRTIDKTLCTFLTTKKLIDKYWENFNQNCIDRYDPFEKYINKIYQIETCISPLKSLSLHMTNINSSYGLSPFVDYEKLWDDNKLNA